MYHNYLVFAIFCAVNRYCTDKEHACRIRHVWNTQQQKCSAAVVTIGNVSAYQASRMLPIPAAMASSSKNCQDTHSGEGEIPRPCIYSPKNAVFHRHSGKAVSMVMVASSHLNMITSSLSGLRVLLLVPIPSFFVFFKQLFCLWVILNMSPCPYQILYNIVIRGLFPEKHP